MVTRKLGAVWLLLLLIVCGGEPTSPPTEIVTKEGLRFRAAAFRGDDDIGVVTELLNTSGANRHLAYGGCAGFSIRLYRSGSIVRDSYSDSDACDTWGASATISPQGVFVYRDSLFIDASLSPGRYNVVMVFKGDIDGARSNVAVAAGAVDL